MNDTRRPDATGPDYEYSLPIEAVADRYATAGFPRTIRTLQRYCKSKHLDAELVATLTGDKYFVAPYSVTRHLAQIAEMAQLSAGFAPAGHDVPRQGAVDVTPHSRAVFGGATGHDGRVSRHVATTDDGARQTGDEIGRDAATEPYTPPRQGTTGAPRPDETRHDQARQDATRPVDPGLSPKYVEVLERENAFLREQVTKKDHQIEALIERDRETNVLLQGLQGMLRLLGGPRRDEPRQSEADRDEARQ